MLLNLLTAPPGGHEEINMLCLSDGKISVVTLKMTFSKDYNLKLFKLLLLFLIKKKNDDVTGADFNNSGVGSWSDSIPFLGRQIFGLNDPQCQNVLQPPAVVFVGMNCSPQVLHPFVSLCCRTT